MKYTGTRFCIIVIFIQINAQLTHTANTLKQEDESCGQTAMPPEDCGECAEGLECSAGDLNMFGQPECGTCQKIRGKVKML